MPRVNLLKDKYMSEDIGSWIVGQMYRQKLKQKDLADALGTSQSNVCKKLMNNRFEYRDLLIIFRLLRTSDDEIIRIMKMG